MRRILIANQTNYDQDWAAETLVQLLHPSMKAMIMPMEADEGWASDAVQVRERFAADTDYHYDIERPLRSYGLKSFRWIELSESLSLSHGDVLCLFGTDGETCMDFLQDYDLEEKINGFDGILIVLSEAAHMLEGEFESGGEYDRYVRRGLGILSGIHFLMHYEQSEENIKEMIRMLETDGKPILVLSEKSGVLFEEGRVELLGDAFIAEERDLDELYSLL